MKTALSIIIPVYREHTYILKTLKYMEQLADRDKVEIIVSDGDAGSTIRHIPPDWNIRTLVCESGRARQMNAGAKLAKSECLLFLHADTLLPHSGITAVIRNLKHVQAGAFALRIASKNILLSAIAAIATLRSIVSRVPFGDQAQFFTKSLFDSLGGYPPTLLMEDLMIMKLLRKKHIPIRILWPSVTTSARRWEQEGIIRCTARNWLIQILFACGVAPERLIQWYPTQNKKELL